MSHSSSSNKWHAKMLQESIERGKIEIPILCHFQCTTNSQACETIIIPSMDHTFSHQNPLAQKTKRLPKLTCTILCIKSVQDPYSVALRHHPQSNLITISVLPLILEPQTLKLPRSRLLPPSTPFSSRIFFAAASRRTNC